ncbi:unnamed protein product [Oikopleura dioica]|uniref:Uncharacterized protein n=1 Tax=Oikopleura dioica TaxID=34765 RepID=E4X5T4_OIKDI|nr:unnamed protein product [Oikopleura dioica]
MQINPTPLVLSLAALGVMDYEEHENAALSALVNLLERIEKEPKWRKQQNDLLAYSSSTLQPGITSQIQGLLQHSRDAAPALAWGQYLYRMLIARLCRRILTEYGEFNFEQESRLADSIHLLHPLTSMTSRLEIGSQLMLTNIPKFLKRTGEWLKRSHLRSLDSQRSRVAHLFTLALHPREESYKELSRLMLPLGGVSVLQLNLRTTALLKTVSTTAADPRKMVQAIGTSALTIVYGQGT